MKKQRLTISALFILLIAISINGCDKKSPYKIGFVGGLTGRLSDLGTAGRNGVQLAVENINKSGGINGTSITLIIKDDEQRADIARQVDQELIDENVVAIIGHMTSSMTLAALPIIKKNRIIMVSPTTSTNQLSGIDDNFIRVIPPNKSETEHLAKVVFQDLGLSEIAIIYDLSNKGFSEGWYYTFKGEFENRGGRIKSAVSFTSDKNTSLLETTKKAIADNPAGLVIIAGTPDAAGICQQMLKLGYKIPIISSQWAFTKEFIRLGGSAVNDVIFSQTYNKQDQSKRYAEFKNDFDARFGHEPDFGSALAYEATQVVLNGLSRVNATKDLKQAILERRTYKGLQGDITFDKYGDVERPRILVTVKNKQFIIVD